MSTLTVEQVTVTRSPRDPGVMPIKMNDFVDTGRSDADIDNDYDNCISGDHADQPPFNDC
ncbi:MAG: hypothetical protein JOY82_11795 [Streptosporangiaceae bacterium]|nr:hypothetical protein [Streptosporangiaceae bacterium]MBV9855181.1 hypothetical protein [Streptosporangiaceae bacterium]